MIASPEAFATWSAFLGYGEGVEGDLSLSDSDPGNVTPEGVRKGTKWGFSARSYPDLDFDTLTPTIADTLRHADFWTKVRGDELPGPVAFVLAEAAWGSGPDRAIRQLQAVVGARLDGAFGPATMTALAGALAQPDGVAAFVVEFSSQRLLFEASLGSWAINRTGWTRRLFRGAWQALLLASVTQRDLLPPAEPQVAVVVAEKRDIPRDIPAPFGEGEWLLTVRRAT